MSKNEIANSPAIIQIENILKGPLMLVPQNLPVFHALYNSENPLKKYVVIYKMNSGFIQVEANYQPEINKVKITRQRIFQKKPDEIITIPDPSI